MFGKLVFFIVLCSIAMVFAQQKPLQFSANVVIKNQPPMNDAAAVTATIAYDGVNGLVRFDYPNLQDPSNPKVSPIEITDYKAGIRYQLCDKCSAFISTEVVPKYYYEGSSDIDGGTTKPVIVNDANLQCKAYRKSNPQSSGGVEWIWVTQQDKIPCQAQNMDGTILTFSKVSLTAPQSSLFVIPKSANCPPQPVCETPIDLVLVFDQSGSITREEWSMLLLFGNAVVDSFTIGPTQTQIGLVFFSGVDYKAGQDPSVCCGLSDPALPLSPDKTTIKKFLDSHIQTGGHTCINCGIKTAATYEPNPNRAVQTPTKVMLVLTDGYNNRMTEFFAIDVANAKNQGWKIFSVGVANASQSDLEAIASKPISEHTLFVENFKALRGIVTELTAGICREGNAVSSCGPLCQGKCTCGGQCLCPDICKTDKNCKTANVVKSNGKCVGCIIEDKFCPSLSNNKCKVSSCDAQSGDCVTKDIVCTPPDACFQTACDPNVGCVYTDKCSAVVTTNGKPDLCLNRKCDNSTSPATCSATAVVCPAGNACLKTTCDPAIGCTGTPVNCDDGNRCTIDTCDPVLGCLGAKRDCEAEFKSSAQFKANPNAFNCMTFTCDPKVGCTSTVNTCDDNNKCTIDSCDKVTGKCINAPVTCVQDPTDKCSSITCDVELGCVKKPSLVCDDKKACTNDKCDPATGKCVYTDVVCPQATSACVTSACDETAKKCIESPKVSCTAQPNDKCKQTVCDPTTQKCALNTTVTCGAADLCSTAACDPVAGCISTPINCNDNKPCTKDSCDPKTGQCVNTPIAGCDNTTTCVGCTSTDPCNPRVCQNGTCITVPVLCPLNKCAKITPVAQNGKCVCTASEATVCGPLPAGQCGENVCDPATGQCSVKGGRVCNDNDPCTQDMCTLVNGQPKCTFTGITCPGDSPCSRKKCINNNGVAQCVNDTANGVQCTGGSDCATGVCNPNTGQCEYTAVDCADKSSLSCARNKCNPATRKCEPTTGLTCTPTDPVGCGINGICIYLNGTEKCSYQPTCPKPSDICTVVNCIPAINSTTGTCTTKQVDCKDSDPCTQNERCVPDGVDSFGNLKTKCTFDPFPCTPSTDPCKVNKCVNQNGNPVCVSSEVTCPSPDKCSTGKCVNQNGKGICQLTAVNCGDDNKCATYFCDPIKGCNKTEKCNDNNPCTNDLCDPQTGKCSYTPKVCNSSSLCKNGTCDPNVGCIEVPLNCSAQPNITALLTPCSFPICAPNNGCQIAIVPNTLDACGFCNAPGKCNPRSDGVSPGAVAGAVIGGSVVAGCAAIGIGVFAARKAGVLFTPKTDVPIVGANTNPLYADNNMVGDNPFHGHEASGNNDYVSLNN